MIRKYTQRGYSLIELVVYIGLFILLSVVLIRSLVTVMRTYASAARYRALQNNGELVMERITRELRNGTTVTTSACPTTSTSVSIASTDASNTKHTNTFGLTNTAVQLTTDTGSTSSISTPEVSVTSLTFCSFTTTVGTGVKVNLTLTTGGTVSTSASFYSTILLRGK